MMRYAADSSSMCSNSSFPMENLHLERSGEECPEVRRVLAIAQGCQLISTCTAVLALTMIEVRSATSVSKLRTGDQTVSERLFCLERRQFLRVHIFFNPLSPNLMSLPSPSTLKTYTSQNHLHYHDPTF